MAEEATTIEKPRSQSLFPISETAAVTVLHELDRISDKESLEKTIESENNLLISEDPTMHEILLNRLKSFSGNKGSYIKGAIIMRRILGEQAKMNGGKVPTISGRENIEYFAGRLHRLYSINDINMDSIDENWETENGFLTQEKEAGPILRAFTNVDRPEFQDYKNRVSVRAGMADVYSLAKMAEERRSP